MITTTSYSNSSSNSNSSSSSNSKQKSTQFLHLYKTIIYNNKGLIALYIALLLLFVTVPNYAYNYMLAYSDNYKYMRTLSSAMANDFSTIMLCAFVIILPITMVMLLFGYLHNKRAVDFYHSLPISRDTLLFSQFAAGITILAVPIIISQFISLFSFFIFPIKITSVGAIIGSMAWATLLAIAIAFIIFAIAIFVAVNCSTAIELLGYSCGLSVFGLAIMFMWTVLSEQALFGYNAAAGYRSFKYLSPFALIIGFDEISAPQIITLLAWLAIAVILIFFAIKCYRKRSSEWAEQQGRTSLLSLIIKIFASAIGAFLVTSMLIGFVDNASWVYLIGALAGAPLGYILVEVVTAGGFNTIKKSLPIICISTIAMLSFGAYFTFNGFGFVSWVPKPAQVEFVEIDAYNIHYSDSNIYDSESIINAKTADDIRITNPPIKLTSPESIDKFIRLHKAAVASKEKNTFMQDRTQTVTFKYGTKPFGAKYRQYEIGQSEMPLLNAILSSCEVYEKTHPAFNIIPEHVRSVSVFDKLGNVVKINAELTPEKINQLLAAMKKDLLATDLLNNAGPAKKEYGSVVLNLKSMIEVRDAGIEPLLLFKNCSLRLSDFTVNTADLLDEWGMIKKQIDYSNILELNLALPDYVWNDPIVWDTSDGKPAYNDSYNPLNMKLNDPELIKKIMENASTYSTNRAKEIIITISEKNNYYMPYSLFINNDLLLDILKDSNIKIPYLLSVQELYAVAPLVHDAIEEYKKPDKSADRSIREEKLLKENNTFDLFMSQKCKFTVGAYFKEYLPELLEGRTPAVIKAMNETPFLDDSGVPLYYQIHLGLFS